MFYSDDEFNAQVKDLVEMGFTHARAVMVVQRRELEDEMEYNKWRDEMDAAYADELERDYDEPFESCETNDNWYDEQYELGE